MVFFYLLNGRWEIPGFLVYQVGESPEMAMDAPEIGPQESQDEPESSGTPILTCTECDFSLLCMVSPLLILELEFEIGKRPENLRGPIRHECRKKPPVWGPTRSHMLRLPEQSTAPGWPVFDSTIMLCWKSMVFMEMDRNSGLAMIRLDLDLMSGFFGSQACRHTLQVKKKHHLAQVQWLPPSQNSKESVIWLEDPHKFHDFFQTLARNWGFPNVWAPQPDGLWRYLDDLPHLFWDLWSPAFSPVLVSLDRFGAIALDPTRLCWSDLTHDESCSRLPPVLRFVPEFIANTSGSIEINNTS